MNATIVKEFDFFTFLTENKVYKSGIRKRNKALWGVSNISPLEGDKAEIKLEAGKLKKNKDYILVAWIENYIYHFPVKVESIGSTEYSVKLVETPLKIEDRRDYERKEVNQKIEYYLPDRRESIYTGILEDISGSGAKLLTFREIAIAHRISFNTSFLNISFDKLRGKIVWKEQLEDKVAHGIKFQFKNKKHQEELVEVLYD